MRAIQIVECPYCETKNEVAIQDWERPKCYNCDGVYYAEIVHKVSISKFDDKGEDVEFTTNGDYV